METNRRGEVTRLLADIREGNEGEQDAAREELFTLVLDELRQQARRKMSREREGHTWQTEDLVDEVAIRLIEGDVLNRAENHRYFYGAIARAMAQALAEYARRRKAKKRGGEEYERVPLFDNIVDTYASERIDFDTLELVLEELKALSPTQYEVFHLRFFGGLEVSKIAQTLNISEDKVKRDYLRAQTFVQTQLPER
jgi:RNA polymerase sigma factor (TIGR02999 family)